MSEALIVSALLLQIASADLVDRARQELAAGRPEEAIRLLDVASLPYEGLVTLGLVHARMKRGEAARSAFDAAIALEPRRPEAWTERGGLAFLEASYGASTRDLTRALELRDDAYARDLLAASLSLEGRPEEALQQWNRLGLPTLRALSVGGLTRTRGSVVRREILPREGEPLHLDEVRETRRRLGELGVLGRVTLRAVPLGGGKADLETALDERPALGGRPAELLAGLGVNLLYDRVRLRYYNLAGAGIVVGALYRWEEHRPLAVAGFSVARPFGLPFHLHLDAFRGRQDYVLPEPLQGRGAGGGFRLRAVSGPQTTLETGARISNRSFSAVQPYAAPGRLVSLHALAERRLIDARRQRLDMSLRVAASASAWGSDVDCARGELRIGYWLHSPARQGAAIEPASIGGQLVVGTGSSRTPLDEMFAPGASPEMLLPLRGHPQAKEGILGVTPLGRSLLLANVEGRRRLLDTALVQLGVVAFVDAARVAGRPEGGPVTLVDGGVGLRLALKGGTLLRVDYGRGLNDDSRALFVGFNQVF